MQEWNVNLRLNPFEHSLLEHFPLFPVRAGACRKETVVQEIDTLTNMFAMGNIDW